MAFDGQRASCEQGDRNLSFRGKVCGSRSCLRDAGLVRPVCGQAGAPDFCVVEEINGLLKILI